ncbi:MAG: 3-oxoacyl-ACP synthase [Rhodospirillales bacterium]|nr:3-oxoacyl-ACP synthase [Rhodospirillales bacterium]
MRVFVEGIGLRGPGLDGWQASAGVLAGSQSYHAAPLVVPPAPLLPANERRRAVMSVRLALAVGVEALANAGRDALDVASVFTSSSADGETINEILRALATVEREISPTRFHNSVHNAPSGYWSIATQSQEPSTSLCAFDASFAAGILDAAVQAAVDRRPILLAAYDIPYLPPLAAVRPLTATFAAAFVLVPERTARTIARLDIALDHRRGSETTVMDDAGLEALRTGAPAARSLPLLAAIARGGADTVVLDGTTGDRLVVSLSAEECR